MQVQDCGVSFERVAVLHIVVPRQLQLHVLPLSERFGEPEGKLENGAFFELREGRGSWSQRERSLLECQRGVTGTPED